ncbi:MAG: hypothetical protein ACK4VV_12035 [Pseudomonas sp.]
MICLERRDERVVFQRTERMQPNPHEPHYHNRYQGIAYLLADRLFLVDYESLNRREITQTILFPSFRNRVTWLTGLKVGVSDSSQRMPCCARVLYEYLGPSVRLRKAFSLCGLYDSQDPSIDQSIREAVSNDVLPGADTVPGKALISRSGPSWQHLRCGTAAPFPAAGRPIGPTPRWWPRSAARPRWFARQCG